VHETNRFVLLPRFQAFPASDVFSILDVPQAVFFSEPAIEALKINIYYAQLILGFVKRHVKVMS